MSWLSDAAKGGAEGLLTGIGTLAKDIRTAITGETPLDPNKRAELLMKVQDMEAATMNLAATFEIEQMKGQLAINLAEAQSASIFKGGWRPYIGWVCGFGLTYELLVKTILPWTVSVVCLVVGRMITIPPMPGLDMGTLVALISAMLGVGGMRMMEKKWGVAAK